MILDGYIVNEGDDYESTLCFYSQKPVSENGKDFSARDEGDCVFILDLPIRQLMAVNAPQRCKITIELEK